MTSSTSSNSDPATTLYQARFIANIQRSLTNVQSLVTRALPTLPSHDRQLAMLALSYGLKAGATWRQALATLLAFAPIMEQAGHRQDWIPYLLEGIEISRQLEDRPIEAELRFQLGVLYEFLSQLEPARAEMQASAALFAALNQPHEQARALTALASIACSQQHFDEARALLAQASPLFTPDDPELAHCNFVEGTLALQDKRFDVAENQFREALARWQRAGDQRMVAWALTNLGTALRRQGCVEEALTSHHEALTRFAAVDDPLHEAIARSNLAVIYANNGDAEAALALFQAAETIFRQLNSPAHLANTQQGIAFCCRKLRRWADAEVAYRTSIVLFEQLEDFYLAANALDGLGLALAAQDKTAEARAAWQAGLQHLTRGVESSGTKKLRANLLKQLHFIKEADL